MALTAAAFQEVNRRCRSEPAQIRDGCLNRPPGSESGRGGGGLKRKEKGASSERGEAGWRAWTLSRSAFPKGLVEPRWQPCRTASQWMTISSKAGGAFAAEKVGTSPPHPPPLGHL